LLFKPHSCTVIYPERRKTKREERQVDVLPVLAGAMGEVSVLMQFGDLMRAAVFSLSFFCGMGTFDSDTLPDKIHPYQM
jgi:GH24 family phage-related lysozyme (muramidase)